MADFFEICVCVFCGALLVLVLGACAVTPAATGFQNGNDAGL